LIENYECDIIINSYHPELHWNNPNCISGDNIADPENIVLDSWPPHKLPNIGIGYPGMACMEIEGINGLLLPIPVTGQWDIRVGLYGIQVNTEQEFYPTEEEIAFAYSWWKSGGRYVVIHAIASPPRTYYNQFRSVPQSNSEGRARSSRQIDWPYNKWAQLVKEIKQMGWAVLQVGRNGDDIVAGVKDLTWIGPRNTAALIGHADLLIGQPSFPMFAANAMNTPIVALWNGSYNSERSQFGDIGVVGHKGYECYPCCGYKNDCPGYCMDDITVEEVLQEVIRRIK
jgi:hypothetical protein